MTRLSDGTAPRIRQDESQANYAPKLDRDSGRIDWTQPAFQLDRLVRAMNPWPGAYTLLDNPGGLLRLKLHRVLPIHRLPGKPGIVMHHVRRGIVVGTGEGSLLLLEVQLEGKRRMSAAEFLRGFTLPAGNGVYNERERAGMSGNAVNGSAKERRFPRRFACSRTFSLVLLSVALGKIQLLQTPMKCAPANSELFSRLGAISSGFF